MRGKALQGNNPVWRKLPTLDRQRTHGHKVVLKLFILTYWQMWATWATAMMSTTSLGKSHPEKEYPHQVFY